MRRARLEPRDFVLGVHRIVLFPDPVDEIFERWQELAAALRLVGLFFGAAVLLCGITVSQALRPLQVLTAALPRLGTGERDVLIANDGPREVAAVGAAFNRLATSLQRAQDQNRDLRLRATVIAEQERAQISRDLHDDVGPLLFAVTVVTATVGRLAAAGDVAAIPAHLNTIQQSTASIQRAVRAMLARLHDAGPQPPSLADALQQLVEFWRGIQPGIAFQLRCPDDVADRDPRCRDVLFRVAQEAVSNAVRHGRPRHVRIGLCQQDDWAELSVADVGTAQAGAPGYGLTGMRARVAAADGTLSVIRAAEWTVTAHLPLRLGPAPAADYEPAALAELSP